jgi:prolyl oligopeptidase
VNQAPELYALGMADVGVMDCLRYHKFTIGAAWKSDFGDPDKEEDFSYIIKWSPLHNVNPAKTYPAVLLLTADHDDRVVPLHSLKLMAEMQYQLGAKNPNPLMIRVNTKAGHGAGKSTQQYIEEYADKITYLATVSLYLFFFCLDMSYSHCLLKIQKKKKKKKKVLKAEWHD